MNQKAIAERQEPAANSGTAVTPSTLLSMAVQQNADLQKLEKLMELEERWKAAQARQAFNEAVAAFKANPPKIIKDKDNKQYNSKYVSLENLVNTANPELSKHGLNVRWDVSQESGIKVTCILSHSLGHQERVSMVGAPDDSGKKNALQQIKSTVTYLKGATFEAVTGLASSEFNEDDDGNSSGASSGLTENQVADFTSSIEALIDVPSGEKLWGDIVKLCKAENDKTSYDSLKAKITAKIDSLRGKK